METDKNKCRLHTVVPLDLVGIHEISESQYRFRD